MESTAIAGLAPWAILILRVMMALVFIIHGYPKLFGKQLGPKGLAGWFKQAGIPLPGLFAYLVGLTEFFGGIALGVGFLTRWAALLIGVIMIVAILKVKRAAGFTRMDAMGYEYDLALLAVAVALVILGGGNLSVDSAIGWRV